MRTDITPTFCCPMKTASQIHAQYPHTHEYRAANDEPLRQVGIHDRIENTHEKRSVRGFDARTSFKPRFSQSERARQPRNRLDDNGVDE